MPYTDDFDDDDPDDDEGLARRKVLWEQLNKYDVDCIEIAEVKHGKLCLEKTRYGVNLWWDVDEDSRYSDSMHQLLNACRTFRAIVKGKTPARNYKPYKSFVCTLASGHYALMKNERLLIWFWNENRGSNLGPSFEPEVAPYIVQRKKLIVKKLSECQPPKRPKKPRETLD